LVFLFLASIHVSSSCSPCLSSQYISFRTHSLSMSLSHCDYLTADLSRS
jgi:hypothetical protein